MAPAGSKRKRPDHQSSNDEGANRASPHRPENLGMAQQASTGSPARPQKASRRASRQDHQNQSSSASGTSKAAAPQGSTPSAASEAQNQRDTPAIESSQPSTPAPRADAPARSQEQDDTHPTPAPYMYEFLEDAVLEGWSERRQEIITAASETDEVSAGIILQELVRSALDGRLSTEDSGVVVKDIIAAQQDYQSLFLSTLSILDDADTKNPKLLELLVATGIDPEVIRQELDVPLLQTLSLVRSTFERIRTRKTTNLLYRQANFNLLREESEGYAKLVTEYFNTANEAVVNPDVSAKDAFQRVTALVGSFDLDVGRVLDITLDISANLLVRAYGFFVRFYRCSSWWPENGLLDTVKYEDQGFSSFPDWALPGFDSNLPGDVKAEKQQQLAILRQERDVRFWARVQDVGINAFFDLGARNIIDFEAVLPMLEEEMPAEYDPRGNEINMDRRKRINETRRFMIETRTLPPQGNSDAAQLLGFKLRFYASSARDAGDILPENLVYLAALLIKIGFISLRDLYPHLYPLDEQMPEEKTRLEKEKREKDAKERPGAASNALAMAGALPDDTAAPLRGLRGKDGKEVSGGNTPSRNDKDKKTDVEKEELPPPTNQKILLLKALLLIGALPEALYILGRFPWIAEVDSSLPSHLLRVAKQMLSKMAESVKPIGNQVSLANNQDELKDTLPDGDGNLRFEQRPPKRNTRWLGLDQVEKTDGQVYRHYYPDWEENIPVCQNVDDVFSLCNTFLGFLGVKIGQDAELFETLIRIAKSDLTSDGSDANRSRWLELMKRLLAPALSLSKHNPSLSQSVYELLMFFPTATRYNIYAEWYLGRTSRSPDMRVAFDHNRAEAKDVLRRVTNETGKKQARALAKVAFSSPGIVVMSMINQLESYSNMIPSLVECTRYFSLLAWDVLNWCLLNSLGGQGRDRIQADGMLTSPWLQALSTFVATLFLRYSIINPSPVLQYLAFELRGGNSTDLEMFEQILAEMAGIKSDMMFTDAQVLAMAGGEHLQAQIVLQLADKRHARKSSAVRLIKALAEHRLVGQFLISIAQERQMYPDRDDSKYMPLKVLGTNLDKIQAVFAQYLDVLKSSMTIEDFEAAVPDVISLIKDFGLAPGVAFTMCRAVIFARINEYDDAAKKQEMENKRRSNSSSKGPATTDSHQVEMKIAGGSVKVDQAAVAAVEGEAQPESVDEQGMEVEKPVELSQEIAVSQPWHEVLLPLIQSLPEAAPGLADRISIPFYVTFWTLTFQDTLVHPSSYETEIVKLGNQIKQINADRTNVSSTAAKEKERRKKDVLEIQDNLREELRKQIVAYQKTRQNRLNRKEKDHWFARGMDKEEIDARHLGILQECFLPRALMSSLDAHYCFLMLKMLHDNGTPGFSIMHFLNQLLRKHELAALMFQCTATEAQYFGRFLCETLKLLQGWHADKAVYEKEALGIGGNKKLPGFAKKLDANGEPEAVIGYEEFRRLLFNWHSYLNGALQMCFESGEFMHIRNGINVLSSIVQVFPTLNFMGQNMIKQVTRLFEEDPRQDLKLAANSLRGPLQNRQKQWMMPQAFRLNDTSKEGGKSGRSNSARPETPQANSETSKLNAAAEEFKPGNSNLANGTPKKEAVGPEDGEIDEKPVAEKNEDVEMKDAPATKPETKSEVKKESEEAKKPSASARGTPAPAASPAPLPPAPASRTESPRPPSNATRPSHSLPTRPEHGPSKRQPPPSAQNDRGYPGRPDDRYGRLERPSDLRPSSRDHSPSGRSLGRTPDRDGYPRGQSRDDRAPARSYGREDLRRPQPLPGPRDRPNGSMGPPSTQSAHPDKEMSSAVSGPPTPVSDGSAKPQSSSANTQHNENPARMALINDDRSAATGGNSTTSQPDARREREGHDDRGTHRSSVRASARNAPPESPRDQPHQDQQSDLAPTGPRHGRLNRDAASSQQQESSYGRLNTPQDASPTLAAPNGPAARGSRAFGSQSASRAPESPLPSPSGRPSDPGFRGQAPRYGPDRRASNANYDRSPATSMPSTPTTEAAPPVHPSRMGQVNTTAPMAAPAGPRGSNRPSASGSAAESPAANSADKQRRGDRQRASINATLQHSGPPSNALSAPGVNFRVAANAQSRTAAPSPQSSSSASQQPPALASSIDPPPRRSDAPPATSSSSSRAPESRNDLFQQQSRSSRAEESDSHRDSRRRGGEDDRYGRPPPHPSSSRNDSRERGPAYQAHSSSSSRPLHREDPRDDPRGPGGPPHDWSVSSRHEDSRRSSGRIAPGGRREDDRMMREREMGPGPRGYGPPPPHSSSHHRDDGYSGVPPSPGAGYGSRKRRHDDGPAASSSRDGGGFDEAKRRRGGGPPGR